MPSLWAVIGLVLVVGVYAVALHTIGPFLRRR